MKLKDSTDSPHDKMYPEREEKTSFYQVSEPETLYETKPEMSFEEDFNQALETAISMEDFTQRIYKRIEAWPWKEK
ncbi:MAG: hypothetical protein LBU22_14030 [Dysgonamonadaceae bacterium]|jgi:hypothetical protein|nr:hypothetical protein [Dysgonamonadaceae bacterium]